MQSMQRQFGKFMKRSADDSQVAVLLKDFEEADKLLSRIVDSTKAWRDAWSNILAYQGRMVGEFNTLYAPIIGSSEPTSDRQPATTPEDVLARTATLRDEYEDLKTELMQELNAMEDRMIMPTMQAKESLAPMKKTIKKRGDRKLDFEHSQNRVDNYAKKAKRSEKDNSALAKAELDLAKATEDYNAADETLKRQLPPLIAAIFSLLPRLLATQIEIQNSMLATYYTVLFNFAQQQRFPSQPPEMDEIMQVWEHAFLPIQQEVEAFSCLAKGKSPRQNSDDSRNGSTSGRLANGLNNFRRRSSGQYNPPPSASQVSTSPGRDKSPLPNFASKPQISASPSTDPYPTPMSDPPSTTPSSITPISFSPAAPKTDYFARDRQSGATNPVAAAAAAKKKPPPPPPRTGSASNVLFVTALYDFGGQSEGDLSFREGDRIRVVKKTESTDDWWDGELRGVKGSFPANYVE
ncbi:SH3 domain protein [Aspergillus sclerotialis]|uniref:SH3 domain protein n=1 Tax=Aspergillus sclerotialis TaxID=2070753 RepID=A0A3A2ZLK9_9EURO|nr:SH3 domain protein [Aspergillus sclerotialis]